MLSPGVTTIMVMLEFLDVGLNTVTKAAMSKGMSQFVLVLYSNILAIFFLVPSSLFFYRKSNRPQLTRNIVYRIFVLSLLSCCGQIFTYVGIGYSSPVLASAMIDLTPGFTFILATISRMEKLDLRVKSSQAKSIGTAVLITGALIVTLYKGSPIKGVPLPSTNNELTLLPKSNWVLGGFILAAHSVILAFFYTVQTWIVRDYPAELMVTTICCIFVTLLSATVFMVAENDPNAWRLRLDMKLIAIIYSAVFAVSLRTLTHTWALKKKGPVYVSMFKPLGMVIALVIWVVIAGDTLYLGSLVGAAIIALGFYAVIWGKAQEENMVEGTENCSIKPSSQKVPLLQNESPEILIN